MMWGSVCEWVCPQGSVCTRKSSPQSNFPVHLTNVQRFKIYCVIKGTHTQPYNRERERERTCVCYTCIKGNYYVVTYSSIILHIYIATKHLCTDVLALRTNTHLHIPETSGFCSSVRRASVHFRAGYAAVCNDFIVCDEKGLSTQLCCTAKHTPHIRGMSHTAHSHAHTLLTAHRSKLTYNFILTSTARPSF